MPDLNKKPIDYATFARFTAAVKLFHRAGSDLR